jgi:hypothetical protein
MSNYRKSHHVAAVLISISFCFAACNKGTAPKSTSTTTTQTTTANSAGDKTSSETKETRTEAADGTQTVHRTETTNQTVPKDSAPPAAPSK